MNRFVVPVALAVVLAGATAAARSVPTQAPAAPPGIPVPAAVRIGPAAAAPVCGGPETLVAPPGGRPQPPAGPVVVAAAAAPPDGPGPGGASRSGDPAPAAAALQPVAGTPSPRPTAVRPVGSSERTAAGGVRLVAATRGRAPVLSAVQASLVRQGDLRGLTAAACPAATTDAWLLGGGTVEGRRARLLLTNPTSAVATVDVTVSGPRGPVRAPGGLDLSIPPGGSRAVQVDALAPGLDALAVHVTARSGRFVAVLADSLLRGLVPGGVDDVTPSAPPARRQLVPGLSVGGSSGAGTARDAAAPGAYAVRVAVPGRQEAVVRVSLLGPDGPVHLPGGGVLTVPARGVRDLDLHGLFPGPHAVVVEADVPVVASALAGRTVAGGEKAGTPAAVGSRVPPSEFAWSASAAPLAGPAVVAVPGPALTAAGAAGDQPVAFLLLSAPGRAASVRVRQVSAAGAAGGVQTLAVPAGTSVQVVLQRATASVEVDPDPGAGPVAAALVLSAPDPAGRLLAAVPVTTPPPAGGVQAVVRQDRRLGLDRR